MPDSAFQILGRVPVHAFGHAQWSMWSIWSMGYWLLALNETLCAEAFISAIEDQLSTIGFFERCGEVCHGL
jgi:hypothetical protein